MSARVLQTTHELPTPWAKTEEERLAVFAAFRESVQRDGGTIISERRVHNIAFDARGERTTLRLVVDWTRRP